MERNKLISMIVYRKFGDVYACCQNCFNGTTITEFKTNCKLSCKDEQWDCVCDRYVFSEQRFNNEDK